MQNLPPVRGTLTADRPLADLTWMRVGGPAEMLFQPADVDDLAAFLAALDPTVPVFPMGVGSNLIVRDGGIPGVVVRLGRGFNSITIDDFFNRSNLEFEITWFLVVRSHCYV